MIWTVLGTAAIVLAAVGIGIVVDRWWGGLPRPREQPRFEVTPHALGTAPATAIRATAAERERMIGAQACPICSSPMTAGHDDRVTYDDRELIVTRCTCPRCASTRTVYVAVID